MLELGPLPAVAHVVRCFQRAGVRDVRVVTGHRAAEVAAAVEPMGAMVVFNACFDLGMFSSVQAGVGTLEPEVQAFFVLPADHPLVRPFTVAKMLDARRLRPEGIVHPTFRGRRGHPPLISCRFREEILAAPCTEGLATVLEKHEQDYVEVAVADKGILLDMDAQEDYRLLFTILSRQAIPIPGECRRIFEWTGAGEPVWQHCWAVAGLAASLARA
ncbi:MAG: nucleotidyltransferase family protein [Peptococcaceae bacterium]|nr:nucleotidyltransferase family protein [Peptococcaceae bacterium]